MRTIHINVKTDDLQRQCDQIRAYLYSNFELKAAITKHGDESYSTVIVNGEDVAGWTAEAH